ncbi:hypothetical protein AB0O07_08020 [Streptomyces sp. NPDC093085]|uniref:hypothetical protein n=1 Tax=Streptomyces sp. NPDC093085 TaxID=3155068 RepID=UPI0034266549
MDALDGEVQPLFGDHAELGAVLGKQLVMGAGIRAELLMLAQEHKDVWEGTASVPDLAGAKKFPNVALLNASSGSYSSMRLITIPEWAPTAVP